MHTYSKYWHNVKMSILMEILKCEFYLNTGI